jgi:hypothetical protein
VPFFRALYGRVGCSGFLQTDTAEELRAALFVKAFFDFAKRTRSVAAILSRALELNVH